MSCFAVLLVLLLVGIVALIVVFGVAVFVTGGITAVVTRRKGFAFAIGVLLMLAGAAIVTVVGRSVYDIFIGDDLRRKQEQARQDGIQNAMRKDLHALAVAEFANQSKNGGFFDVPSQSLKDRDGYELVFFPGPTPPRQSINQRRLSPTSMAAFSIVARRKSDDLRLCVDSRNKICDSYGKVDPQGGFCVCYMSEMDRAPVQPAVLGFTHDGKTPCPQHVGTIKVYNDSESEITTDVHYMFEGRIARSGAGRFPAAPLLFDGNPNAMPGGSSWDPRGIPIGGWSNARIPAHTQGMITVHYNCNATNDFAIDVFVLKDQKVSVYGTINP